MSSPVLAGFLDLLRTGPLLEPEQRRELDGLAARLPDAKALARELLGRGWLTAYQANQLLTGRGADLVLGSYVVLDRLGEGGMGAVFKAGNWKLGQVVALKVIRQERVANPQMVRRFEREVQAAAQLEHPNIVRAYDAGEVRGCHFLVMEYVEGTDLAHLVKRRGPLPVAEACAYARQAALGLQHAHERGLVHRDIKPANLLLTKQGVVKVLDMGLARLAQGDQVEGSTTLTGEGVVMGTPDYIAPEQVRAAHAADIRADLYSLGCTLYYLLAGHVPFPGQTAGEKIAQHLTEEPAPVERVRPDIPPGVAAVVRKLMAKRPEDRYQTPAELAAALAPGADGDGAATAVNVRPAAGGPLPAADDTVAGWSSVVQAADGARRPDARGRAERRRWLLVNLVGVAGVAAGAVVIVTLFWRGPGRTQQSAAPDPQAAVAAAAPVQGPARGYPALDDAWVKRVAEMPAAQQVEKVGSELKRRNPGFDGKVTSTIEGGTVTGLVLQSNEVTDLTPVRALTGLRNLFCAGAKVTDLSPLKGMSLVGLVCINTGVTDLSPLVGMPLRDLALFSNTRLADLAPLKGMHLTSLHLQATSVHDLRPLRGMPLTVLNCTQTKVDDLSPLRGVPLNHLSCAGTNVSDLSALRGRPITYLDCSMTQVGDLEPLRGLPLQVLGCLGTRVADLAPLKGMPLTQLVCAGTQVSDLTPLKNSPLTYLSCISTPVADLTPLKGMDRLVSLFCEHSKVTDLSPLRGLPLKELSCDFIADRDAPVLRSIKTLEKINGKPAAEFWKQVGTAPSAKK